MQARGAEIYAEFLGGSFTCDAYHMTEPHPDGMEDHFNLDDALNRSLSDVIITESVVSSSDIFVGTGVRLCIEKALAQSGVRPQDVNYVNAHATSTRAGDLQEYKALMRVFGENPEVLHRRDL